MFGYLNTHLKNAAKARGDKTWKDHLDGGGPYHYQEYLKDGKQGVLATPRIDIGNPVAADELSDNIEKIDDDIFYFHLKENTEPFDLLKENGPNNAIDVVLSCGITVSMPIAMQSARAWNFKKNEFGDHVNDFGKMANKIINNTKKSVPFEDVAEFIFLGLSLNYFMTRDVINDLSNSGVITTDDFLPLYQAGLGLDPKSSGTKKEEQK